METVRALVNPVPSITPYHTVNEVGDLLLSDVYRDALSLPIVEAGKPVGAITRHTVMRIFLNRFGREIFGDNPVGKFMDREPIIVQANSSIETASQQVSERIRLPLTEDFILADGEQYVGMGAVLSLLSLLQTQLEQRSQALAEANVRIRASQAQLIQSEKMASLGQMVAGVAHEINTPLGYVGGNLQTAQLLLEDLRQGQQAGRDLLAALLAPATSPEQLEQTVAHAGTLLGADAPDFTADLDTLFADALYGVEQITDLVGNLKDFSRLDRAASENVDIVDCIESALKIGHSHLKHRVEVVRDFDAVRPISCIPSQLNQVFLNLFANAAQAIEGKGKLLIRVKEETAGIRIQIQDNGRGIPPDVLDRVFDPFFTTKPVGQGTGLGLSICYQIVQQHKGRIDVWSREGVGTRFSILLPFTGETQATVEQAL
ncbi:hypothetical protein CAI21_20535 [Alkalilimnicola ehrlichii]|uniref:histidine kinase n=1 Tax=Alkalilimnicola ehrlichii TaxID=351052 RepID=A0A3E0WRF9_9GAMM|nr:ATP-binding protein [Alkalilimnicola ehrlichii]RFA24740.1 hypothetical protein CAI21_20535 [Alkalilimnicola ehrlichii]RFA35428.1 hypothetical protein CAL65_13200 [Alkalilimnicola ehrlichii]